MRVLGLCFVAMLFGFISGSNQDYPTVKNESFGRGEVINFKINVGIFTVGRANVTIQPEFYKINERECFKIDVYGKTSGMVNWFTDVDDQYGAYVDTGAIVPHQFYRFIREGRYKKDEWTNFDHANKKIEVKTLDNKTGKLKDPVYFDAPTTHVRDMIGGFLFLRSMDLTDIKENDTVSIKSFYEDEFYDFKIVYTGKQTIRVKAGKIRTMVFKPVMPKNKVFDGKNAVTVWLSDDKNRIPIKISTKMFIGHAGVELTDYSGLKNRLNVAK